MLAGVGVCLTCVGGEQVILVFMDVGVNLAITAIDVVLDVVNIIIRVVKTFDHHLHTKELQLLHWVKIPLISVAEFKRVVNTLISTCAKFDSFVRAASGVALASTPGPCSLDSIARSIR